jgi:hypothetical protein
MAPRTLRLNPAPDAGLLPERAHCEVYELEDIVTQIRHLETEGSTRSPLEQAQFEPWRSWWYAFVPIFSMFAG